MDQDDLAGEDLPTIDPQDSDKAAKVVFWVLTVVIIVGVATAILLRPGAGPPPEEIANDPMLVQGRELYNARCVSCHGRTGQGDGPIAAMVKPTKPGDLTDHHWKHGDRPDQVVQVIARGIPGTGMDAWDRTFDETEIRALAAYVFYLAGRAVPEELRGSGQDRTP